MIGKWTAGHDDWLWDGGEITEKQYLPVRALHFGDTGTPMDKKEGRYSLGPLECDGDSLFENIVTFRKSDAVIELPTLEMGQVSMLCDVLSSPTTTLRQNKLDCVPV
jgi:hypothetical protein